MAAWAASSDHGPGSSVGDERPSPGQESVEGALGVAGILEAPGDVVQAGRGGGVGRVEHAAPLGGEQVIDLAPVGATFRRSTRPRATRPSTMAVTLGGRTARRSARWD